MTTVSETLTVFTCAGCGSDKEGTDCQRCGSGLIQVAGFAPLDSVEAAARAVRLERARRDRAILWP